MADLSSITYISATGNSNSVASGGMGSAGRLTARGTFPISSATATCPIGDLLATDVVVVRAQQAVTGHTIPYVEILASRTNGAQGVVTVGTQDGSTSPASTIKLEITKWRV